MKKLVFSLIVILFFVSCKNSINSSQQVDEKAMISIEILADRFGNHDDIATADEAAFLQSYFAENQEAWTICNSFDKYGEAVPADAISENLLLMGKPYKSASDLRNAYNGIGIKTPVIGICRIIKVKLNNYYVTELYSCPGPSVYASEWEKKIISK